MALKLYVQDHLGPWLVGVASLCVVARRRPPSLRARAPAPYSFRPSPARSPLGAHVAATSRDVCSRGDSLPHSVLVRRRPPFAPLRRGPCCVLARRRRPPFALYGPQVWRRAHGERDCVAQKKISCEFVLLHANRNFKLWDPQGKSWDVKYVYYSERSVGAFSAGWGKFAVGNNLEKFDVCIFELFAEDNIKVHIYGVVPEITPFLPGPGRK